MSETIRKTFKYRLFVSKKQANILDKQLEECRWVYNQTLALRRDAWTDEHRSISLYDTNKLLTQFKASRPSLYTVNAQVLQNVQERVDLAFQAFFRRVKSGEQEVGYPRFKGYLRYDSLTFKQPAASCEIKQGKLKVSKVGNIKLVLHRPIPGTIKTVTLTRSATGKWYACFSVEVEPKRLPPHPKQEGIDVGLKTFATLSDGVEIENPRFFRVEEKALAKANRKLAKTPKPARGERATKERCRARKVVARVHERTQWRRSNFTHQASRKIVNGYGLIAVEDLNVNRMVHNHCLAKSIADAAWSSFFNQLSSKAAEAGRQFIKVNPAYTSQTCSDCGHRASVKLTLSDRIFDCECCNLHIDRDLNAALNIKSLGLQAVSLPQDAPAFRRGE